MGIDKTVFFESQCTFQSEMFLQTYRVAYQYYINIYTTTQILRQQLSAIGVASIKEQ